MTVRPRDPLSCSAAIRFSGRPHRPNPQTMIDAPSGMSRTASAASFTTLFIGLPAPIITRRDIIRGTARPPAPRDDDGLPEFTARAALAGIVFGLLFGAANAY